MRVRELPRMIPRFLDGTVARQQSESQESAGKGWDTLSLAVVIKKKRNPRFSTKDSLKPLSQQYNAGSGSSL